jgi:hypothetical protein
VEPSRPSRIDDDRCQNLRWKGLYLSAEWDYSVSGSGDRLYWCHRTQQCLGPDGKVVDDYECNETRACYRAL